MKRFCGLSVFLLVGSLVWSANTCFAQKATDHPAPDVDGQVWMQSTEQEKEAFLFGAGSAIVLEYHVRDKHSEAPSLFVRGWVEGLKDISWKELANRIDDYYRKNPEQMHKHVFEVIWQEVIMPNIKS